MSYSRTHRGLLLLALLNACVRITPAHLTSLEQDPIANQSAPQSCTATGPAAIPHEVIGGLHEGPHSLIVNGVRLWYCVAGTSTPDTPPAVFVHGGPGQGSFHFAALVGPHLEPSLRMVYLDQRGSGRSERPWTDEYSMQVLIEDIEELRRALGVPQIALIGHSFGGALALEYAAEYPDHVSRIVLAGGFSNADASGRSQCERLAEVNPEAYARATKRWPSRVSRGSTKPNLTLLPPTPPRRSR